MSKYIGAYLLSVLGGKESPTEADVKAILEAGGIEIDDKMLSLVFKKCSGTPAHEIIASGFGKLEKIGGGGGGGGGEFADGIEAFIAKSRLDAKMIQTLLGEAAWVQQAVIDGGPLHNATNPSSACMSRIISVKKNAKRSKPY
eukprot:gnl/MRDRNA2_/MRDRNA2_90525_c0_seq1.p1 gnl/MRDRNA2_/MRDRNA2_90525_c0~~gnl/MRDRNA2_/MRDRNA2_90525_c0_seq1.p1  ORF type:complete len:143 (+),score=43.24 gnl/MRDRNA2_/MRDRNA2_90525_c0_seq1:68-496(+)